MILIAIVITLLAIGVLCWQDPKRRRVFRQSPKASIIVPRVLWVVIFMPGIILALLGQSAGFVLWLGSASAFGWMLITVAPQTWARFWARRGAFFRNMPDPLSRILSRFWANSLHQSKNSKF